MSKNKIIWDDQAIIDFKNIWEYIARDSAFYADKVSDELMASIERLSEDPLIGPGEETCSILIWGIDILFFLITRLFIGNRKIKFLSQQSLIQDSIHQN
jgi:plasmid stabilization system protein ParE